MFEPSLEDGVLQVHRPGTRWLSTGIDGGFVDSDAAYNLSVPDGWDRTDVKTYVDERRARAGFDESGPALLTGVELDHARGARAGPVEAFATVGLSNPAALPMEPGDDPERIEASVSTSSDGPGTVNLIVGTDRALDDGSLATLLALVAEAKAATLLHHTGFPGTTTDAAVVGADPKGEPVPFAGSATPVGAAARICVREAVRASLSSRYADASRPTTVAEAEHGLQSTGRADVFEL